jgi:hypothetical protein
MRSSSGTPFRPTGRPDGGVSQPAAHEGPRTHADMRTDPGWAIPVTDEVDVVAAYAETATADAEDRPPGGEASAIEDWGNISTLRRPTPHRIAEVPEARHRCLPDQKGGASSPINANVTPPLPFLRPCTTTLPIPPSGSSNVKVSPTGSFGLPPVPFAGRKSPAHGEVPPLRAGSVNSAAVPAVRVPSEERSVAALR